jgi:hypothetical protein
MKTLKVAKNRPPRLSRQHLRDRQWVSEHIQELIDKHPNQWIMVSNCEVLAHSENLGPVVDKADELRLDQPIFHFVERDGYVY